MKNRTVKCPHCGTELQGENIYEGAKILCPECNFKFHARILTSPASSPVTFKKWIKYYFSIFGSRYPAGRIACCLLLGAAVISFITGHCLLYLESKSYHQEKKRLEKHYKEECPSIEDIRKSITEVDDSYTTTYSALSALGKNYTGVKLNISSNQLQNFNEDVYEDSVQEYERLIISADAFRDENIKYLKEKYSDVFEKFYQAFFSTSEKPRKFSLPVKKNASSNVSFTKFRAGTLYTLEKEGSKRETLLQLTILLDRIRSFSSRNPNINQKEFYGKIFQFHTFLKELQFLFSVVVSTKITDTETENTSTHEKPDDFLNTIKKRYQNLTASLCEDWIVEAKLDRLRSQLLSRKSALQMLNNELEAKRFLFYRNVLIILLLTYTLTILFIGFIELLRAIFDIADANAKEL